MAAQRSHAHDHEREQRQRREDGMQFGIAFDVEDADVAVLPGDAPEMAHVTGALQVLRARFFGCLQALEVSRVETVGNLYFHVDLKEHRQPLFGAAMLMAGRPVRSRRKNPIRSSSSEIPSPGASGPPIPNPPSPPGSPRIPSLPRHRPTTPHPPPNPPNV